MKCKIIKLLHILLWFYVKFAPIKDTLIKNHKKIFLSGSSGRICCPTELSLPNRIKT